jgi:acetylglutamate kinase
MKQDLLIVKIGGNVIDNPEALQVFLSHFAGLPHPKLLVHGGGRIATELSVKLGIETRMVDGRRITDDETLKVIAMTYAGWVNKNITALLQKNNCNAIGLSGVDAQLIPANKRPIKEVDYGWVGDVLTGKINVTFLKSIFEQNLTPVIAPVASNNEGQLLNINADTIAQSLAEALSAFFSVTLIYCFEKDGLLQNVNDDKSVISEINFDSAELLKAEGTITLGMLPKIDNAFTAIKNGVKTVVLGNALHIHQLATKQKGYGTFIKA